MEEEEVKKVYPMACLLAQLTVPCAVGITSKPRNVCNEAFFSWFYP